MALKTTKLCFEVEYDDRATTPTKLAKTFDRLFDDVLRVDDVLEDHASDTHGTTGVGKVSVDTSNKIIAAAQELVATGDGGFDDRMTVDSVAFESLDVLLNPPKKRNKRSPRPDA